MLSRAGGEFVPSGRGVTTELAGRDRFVGDRGVVRLCGAMRVLLCAYFLFFLTLPGLFLGR